MNENFEKVADCMQKRETQAVFDEIKDETSQKIAGMIAGNIIGDMLGITQEGTLGILKPYHPVILEGNYQKNIIGGGKLNLNAGDWSDDTSMLIALGESLYEKKCVHKQNELRHYSLWLFQGFYAPSKKAIGYGKTTYEAIKTGQPLKDRLSNGNGALMRSSIITSYYLEKSDETLINASMESASVTHAHPISLFSNAIYSLLLKKIILNTSLQISLEQAKKRFFNLIEDINPIFEKPDIYTTSPYAVTTLQTAIWLNMESNSFEEAVLKAINIGGDTDTIGAITGAIAGAIYGIYSIPKRFLKFVFTEKILKYSGISKFLSDFTKNI